MDIMSSRRSYSYGFKNYNAIQLLLFIMYLPSKFSASRSILSWILRPKFLYKYTVFFTRVVSLNVDEIIRYSQIKYNFSPNDFYFILIKKY